MKRKIRLMALALSAILAVSSCGAKEETPVPEQEILFVIEYLCFSEGEEKSYSMIANDGSFYALPDDFSFDGDWYERCVFEKDAGESRRSVEPSDLDDVYEFVNSASKLEHSPRKEYDHVVYDYGTKSLYLIEYDGDEASYCCLCSYGEKTECLDSETVREFVNWFSEKKYFYMDHFLF